LYRDSVAMSEGRADSTLRWAGVVLLPLLVSEGVLGILAAGSGGNESSGFLAAHLTLGIGIVGFSAWAAIVARRLPTGPATYAAALTFLAIATATTVGSILLVSGNASGALLDRVLGLIALAGAAVMVGWGSVPLPPSPSSAPVDA